MFISTAAPRQFLIASLVATAAFPALWAGPVDSATSAAAVQSLQKWIDQQRDDRPALGGEGFADAPLTKEDAARAKSLLWEDYLTYLRATRADEMKARRIELDGLTMRFEWKATGTRPEAGHSLFISMHGGGGAPAAVNDRQWANQIRLGEGYRPTEGIYLAPRAPTDSWNLWHEAHIDTFFDRIIQNMIALEGINPNRVYLLGYSAGGDGVYQLAPRFADRLAAAAMSAGHPNEASPLGLRNLGFALHMGALDAAYNRNQVAREWGQRLASLKEADPGGYAHQVQIHEGKKHWMELADRVAIPWMEEFTRNPWPDTVVWRQDDVIHSRSYWLAIDPATAKAGDTVVARLNGASITLESSRPLALGLLLDDALVDLDQPVTVTAKSGGPPLFSGRVRRTIAALHQSLTTRGQLPLMASAHLRVPATPPGT